MALTVLVRFIIRLLLFWPKMATLFRYVLLIYLFLFLWQKMLLNAMAAAAIDSILHFLFDL